MISLRKICCVITVLFVCANSVHHPKKHLLGNRREGFIPVHVRGFSKHFYNQQDNRQLHSLDEARRQEGFEIDVIKISRPNLEATGWIAVHRGPGPHVKHSSNPAYGPKTHHHHYAKHPVRARSSLRHGSHHGRHASHMLNHGFHDSIHNRHNIHNYPRDRHHVSGNGNPHSMHNNPATNHPAHAHHVRHPHAHATHGKAHHHTRPRMIHAHHQQQPTHQRAHEHIRGRVQRHAAPIHHNTRPATDPFSVHHRPVPAHAIEPVNDVHEPVQNALDTGADTTVATAKQLPELEDEAGPDTPADTHPAASASPSASPPGTAAHVNAKPESHANTQSHTESPQAQLKEPQIALKANSHALEKEK